MADDGLIDRALRHPFFMDQYEAESEQSVEFKAIKALQEEEPPLEVATNLKDSGNEAFKLKRYRHAVDYYTQALEIHSGDDLLDSVIYSNIGEAQIRLKNYGKARDACTRALELNPDNFKASFRYAMSLDKLGRYSEALPALRSALAISPSTDSKRIIRTEITRVKAIIDLAKKKQEKSMAEDKLVKEKEAEFSKACAIRGVVLGVRDNSILSGYYEINNYLDNDIVHWSVLLMYPGSGQTDFIQDWDEAITFKTMLAEMFPRKGASTGFPEWDERHEYCVEDLAVLVADGDHYTRVQVSTPLHTALTKYHGVVQGCPVFMIVSTVSDHWKCTIKPRLHFT